MKVNFTFIINGFWQPISYLRALTKPGSLVEISHKESKLLEKGRLIIHYD